MSILERLEQMERRMAEMAARDGSNQQQQQGSQLATPPPPPLPEEQEQVREQKRGWLVSPGGKHDVV